MTQNYLSVTINLEIAIKNSCENGPSSTVDVLEQRKKIRTNFLTEYTKIAKS